MPLLGVTINLDDAPWTDLQAKKAEGKLITVVGEEIGPIRFGGLPGGMQSGKAALEIAISLPDGTILVTETSMALFLAAAKILQIHYGKENV